MAQGGRKDGEMNTTLATIPHAAHLTAWEAVQQAVEAVQRAREACKDALGEDYEGNTLAAYDALAAFIGRLDDMEAGLRLCPVRPAVHLAGVLEDGGWLPETEQETTETTKGENR